MIAFNPHDNDEAGIPLTPTQADGETEAHLPTVMELVGAVRMCTQVFLTVKFMFFVTYATGFPLPKEGAISLAEWKHWGIIPHLSPHPGAHLSTSAELDPITPCAHCRNSTTRVLFVSGKVFQEAEHF